ncbi:uncharacterized protein EI97DRAFT_18124 [Westerdykella ornata]|uniref:Uncharacterized protein n=1 Tax=Westerdykella ornata TaxID=318751 RepID=A0A6A6JZ21_WESOR|nr:uncharacterized protein EI97DRAFT_18124 [Westerdykella ornata]KAF2281006.1 hypothetical protein EI97DRAFT_18124 [Westerdykella ornata]
MYRRGDPRWNRTIQHIADNIEHANESTQEHLWTFTQEYINPCLSSTTQCVNTCMAPCVASRDDRRRNRARSRGRAEMSFDFYDDWEEDENDGLLGWGNESFDRFIGGGGGSSNYGSVVSQPGRQRAMSYGTRNRDGRFGNVVAGRRKSAVQPHDGGPDPTIIPSSSYFGFLGRLPFRIGSKGLRYKPSAADLVEHPGQGRRSLDHEERQRSHTNASGHTTDSLSSRGDIFPSEDEIDDAVPLDDEFAFALERRTTGQGNDDASSGKSRPSDKNKRHSDSHLSIRSASSVRLDSHGRRSTENLPAMSAMDIDAPTLSDLKEEEERLRLEEEREIERKRQSAKQLALQRGLASETAEEPASSSAPMPNVVIPRPTSSTRIISEPPEPISVHPSHQESNETLPISSPAIPFPTFEEPPQTAPESSSFHVDDSDFSSFAPTPNRPLSIREVQLHRDEPVQTQGQGMAKGTDEQHEFVPARLPFFGSEPG